MIWLETPIISDVRFSRYTRLYKRFIDDLFLIWTGPGDLLCDLRRVLARANKSISFVWSGYDSQLDVYNPSVVTAERHAQVDFLDLDMTLHRKGKETKVIFRPSRLSASREMLTLICPSTLSIDATFFEGGCWRSCYGSRLML